MSDEEKKAIENDILFQIDMKLYDEFNNQFCVINEYLGEIYSYKDLEDLEKFKKYTEIKLLRQAVIKLQSKIDKALKFIDDNRYIDDNGCGLEWEAMDDIDELVLILKGE